MTGVKSLSNAVNGRDSIGLYLKMQCGSAEAALAATRATLYPLPPTVIAI